MKRWLLLLLLLLIPVLMMPAAALDGWLYYRDITISNSLDQELTNYQVKIVLDTYSLILGGKMRSDCGDIRFTDSGGNLLPYWVEPGTCNSQNTVIWVKVPSIPASGQTTIRLWYGNTSAESLSDVSSVFITEIGNVTASWLMDEGSGDTVYDTSGNDNHGTIYGATWVDSPYGKALSFDGVDDYIRVLDSPSLRNDEITVDLWLYLHSKDKTMYFVGKAFLPGTGTSEGWVLYYHSSTDSIRFYIVGEETTKYAAYSNPPTHTWLHIVGTYENGTIKIYVNGELKDTESQPTIRVSTRDLYIGSYYGILHFTDGLISHVSIYNRALTDEEIVAIYNNRIYTTPAYPGKVLIRAYASQEPSLSISDEVVFLPDIVVTDFTVPSQLAVQQPFNVDMKVKNIGNKSAGSFKVGIYVENIGGEVPLFFSEQTVNSLDIGEEVQLSFSITVNQPGNLVIKAMADIYNEVEEISETNNEASVLRYVAAPDLTITKLEVSPQLNVIVGRSVTITATVANLGDASASNARVLATVKLNNETQYSEERRISLAPQQSTELAFTFTPVKNGTHVIEIIIDPDNRFIEHNENNNAATASIEVGGLPFRTPTPPQVGGKTFREIYEPLTLRTYNLPLEAMSLIAVLGISVVGYGFGVFRGTVNFFFLSVIYFIVSTFLGWSMFIAAGLLAVATMLLVVTVAFVRED